MPATEGALPTAAPEDNISCWNRHRNPVSTSTIPKIAENWSRSIYERLRRISAEDALDGIPPFPRLPANVDDPEKLPLTWARGGLLTGVLARTAYGTWVSRNVVESLTGRWRSLLDASR